jgi:hypothetical protein
VWNAPEEYPEALRWLRARAPMSKAEFDALTTEAREKAFTVAGVAQLDIVAQVWEAVERATAEGLSLAAFKKAVTASLEAAWGGTVAHPPWRIETIFRTNLQLAYSRGRYEQMTDPDVLEARPYWKFDAVLDGRQTHVCEVCADTVLPADHAWWKTHVPPLHFNCRSAISTLTEEDAAELGVTSKPANVKAEGTFGNAPERKAWEPDADDYPAQLWEAFEAKQSRQAKPLTREEFVEAFGRTADAPPGAATRAAVRGLLAREGIESRDVELGRDFGVVHVRGEGRIAYHHWDGSIELPKPAAARLQAVAAKMARKQPLDDGDIDILTTMVHEELHGASPITKGAFKGLGVVFEEAGTESLARRVLRDQLGGENFHLERPWLSPTSVERESRPYDGHIADIYVALRDGAGIPAAQVPERFEQAILRMRSAAKHAKLHEDESSYVDGVCAALELKGKKRERFLTSLRNAVLARLGG